MVEIFMCIFQKRKEKKKKGKGSENDKKLHMVLRLLLRAKDFLRFVRKKPVSQILLRRSKYLSYLRKYFSGLKRKKNIIQAYFQDYITPRAKAENGSSTWTKYFLNFVYNRKNRRKKCIRHRLVVRLVAWSVGRCQ